MNGGLLCVIIVLSCLRMLSPLQDQESKMNGLTATVSQSGEQHCKSYPHLFAVFIHLSIKYTNSSNHPIIVARMPMINRERVSLSRVAFGQEKFIYSPRPYGVTPGEPKPLLFGKQPDADRFMILAPGAEYRTSAWTEVLADLTKDQHATMHSGPLAGRYVMQVYVHPWPYDPTVAAQVAETWKKWGSLAYRRVPSNIFDITLPKEKSGTSCERFRVPK